MRTRALAAVAALVVVAAAILLGVRMWHSSHRTALEQALRTVPASSRRVSFTDWAQVRANLGVKGIDSTPRQISSWMNRAYNKDYSAASSMNDEAPQVARYLGFSPGNASWEAYAQSRTGATMVLRMDDGVDFGKLASRLTDTGFKPPSTATGVWRGGPSLIAGLNPNLNPEVQYVVLLAHQHLVITSDTRSYAGSAAQVAEGHGASLGSSLHSVDDMAGKVGDPADAVVWADDFACSDLAMSQADAGSQRQAARLIAQAGQTTALDGLLMAMAPDRALTVAEEFSSSGEADQNLRARARLAVGETVGRGSGTFADQFKLTSARTRGSTVLLVLRPRNASEFVLSALYDGPVIFATC